MDNFFKPWLHGGMWCGLTSCYRHIRHQQPNLSWHFSAKILVVSTKQFFWGSDAPSSHTQIFNPAITRARGQMEQQTTKTDEEEAALAAIATLSSPIKPVPTSTTTTPPMFPQSAPAAAAVAATIPAITPEEMRFLIHGQNLVHQTANQVAKQRFDVNLPLHGQDAAMEDARLTFHDTFNQGMATLQSQLLHQRHLHHHQQQQQPTKEEQWRDSLINRLIQVEYGSLWYTCKVVCPCKNSTTLFRVRYEEDDTEETLILNEDFTAHQEKQADVFQWRMLTEDIAQERAVKIEKQAQAKALLTEQRANAKAMKIEKDAMSKALRIEKEALSKALLLEREAQQRTVELDQQARERAMEIERLANAKAEMLSQQLASERQALEAAKQEFERQQERAAKASTEEEEPEETPVKRKYKKRRDPLDEDDVGDRVNNITKRELPRRLSKPVEVFKPPVAKKKARHSEPIPRTASAAASAPKLKALGYVPKGKFGFVPPVKQDAVGWRVRVYWKEDKTFYRGQIEAYSKKKHQIIYEDGEEEMLKLDDERVEWFLPADSDFELYGIDVEEALEQQQRK